MCDRNQGCQLGQSCKSSRAFWVGFGPKVDKIFGAYFGPETYFLSSVHKNVIKIILQKLLDFSDLT